MANLGCKDGIYHVRFRFQDKEYKRSLKARKSADAEAAKRSVEQTIHRLLIGLLEIPEGVDPGDFILSGGTLKASAKPDSRPAQPSTRELIDRYLESQQHLLAPNYLNCQKIHLRHLTRHLGDLSDLPCGEIAFGNLDAFIQKRLAERDPNTAAKERTTLIQLYKWAVRHGYISSSPASSLAPIKAGSDRPPFRTIQEIERILERGGLSEEEKLDLWDCLFLAPSEIAALLMVVRERAGEDFTVLLHAIPAYTGMRRGEVLRLRWVDVDLDEGYLYARSRKQSRSKSETVRRIDLHPELKQELIAWKRKRPKGQYVICDKKTLLPLDVNRANRCFWQSLRGTEWCLDSSRNWFKVGYHSYRHSFASNLAAAGVDQRIIDQWMGHVTEAMRRRYQHLTPTNLQTAIRSFSYTPEIKTGDHRE